MNKPVKSGNGKERVDLNSVEGWRRDFFASIVVFLVALPLCIGIAVAVGVSPARALITGIVGGLIVGFFAGSPLQVSGPAAGLFVIVADLIADRKEHFLLHVGGENASQEDAMAFAMLSLGVAVFLSGIIQFVAGKLSLGQWFRAVSPAVIRGMLAGIGVLIVVSQFHVMLDHPAMWHGESAHGGWQYAATIPEAIWKCFAHTETKTHHLAAATGVLTIAVIVFWQSFMPKKIQLLPASLVAVIVATGFALVTNLNVHKLDVPANMFAEVSLPNLTSLGMLLDSSILISGLVIAIVASAETLLCATAVDQMQQGPRTDYDKELRAQGIGNALCGLVGALPMTGVIVRSSANVNAGALSRRSSILHGLWLLIFVAALPGLLSFIPKAALGGLLVYTGYKLVNFKAMKELWKVSRSEFAIYMSTLILIVATDLLVGVVTGIILSALKLLHRFSNLDLNLTKSDDGQRATLHLEGACTFLRLPLLARELEKVPAGAELHVLFQDLTYIDHACLDLLTSWSQQHQATGGVTIVDWEQLHARFSTKSKEGQPLRDDANNGLLTVQLDLLPESTQLRLGELRLEELGVRVLAIESRVNGSLKATPQRATELNSEHCLVLYCAREKMDEIKAHIRTLLVSEDVPSRQAGLT